MSASEEALLRRVKELEEEVTRLRGQLKGQHDVILDKQEKPPKPQENGSKKVKRPFDFSQHPRRHLALRLAYLGWQYQGFAVQENTENTVEARLFDALIKTKLIQDRQSSNYHRCGRTDKGVSAFSQVISIDLRSSQFSGLGVTMPAGVEPKVDSNTPELPYMKILNRVLPPDIRALSWAPVPSEFSARFDCQSRTYRYYFPRGELEVEIMATAARRYEGSHDFRNLCKMDVGNGVLQFQRTILSACIQPAEFRPASRTDPQNLYVFEVKGLAFLYHQVRCMMAVLLLIGQKLEAPEIIDHLLDIGNNPRKPQYSMAVDYPLVLYDCSFKDVTWMDEAEEAGHVISSLLQQWTQTAVKAQVLDAMIHGLHDKAPAVPMQCYLMEGSRQKNYRPLLERPRCESLESRIQHFVKRGRLEREEGDGGDEGSAVFRGKRSKQSHQSNTSSPDEESEAVSNPNTIPTQASL